MLQGCDTDSNTGVTSPPARPVAPDPTFPIQAHMEAKILISPLIDNYLSWRKPA